MLTLLYCIVFISQMKPQKGGGDYHNTQKQFHNSLVHHVHVHNVHSIKMFAWTTPHSLGLSVCLSVCLCACLPACLPK